MFKGIKYIIACVVGLCLTCKGVAQICPKDSNFYSITYNGFNDNQVTDGLCTTANEIITLSQFSVKNSFISKFTAEGSLIWSNEYFPNYPYISAQTFPWYNSTEYRGIIPGDSGTFYAFGSSYEHGRSVNNVETPAGHLVGVILHIDKYGKIITSTYLGNWGTSYTITSLARMNNGNLMVYLRGMQDPFIDKVICVDKNSNILWGCALQSLLLYTNVEVNPIMKQIKKTGHIILTRELHRDLDDTLIYPFLIVILPAPLTYFQYVAIDENTGQMLWQNNYQCPMVTNTNTPTTYVPAIKSMAELPDGQVSIMADMALPNDSFAPFWNHLNLQRRVANVIIDSNGFFQRMKTYTLNNAGTSLEFARPSGDNGEQIMLARDSANTQFVLSKIDNNGDLLWSKSYRNYINTPTNNGVAVERLNGSGYLVFQSDAYKVNFHLDVTNVAGNDSCSQLPATMQTRVEPWVWVFNKIWIWNPNYIVDIRSSPNFAIKQQKHGIEGHIDCQYQETCCKDVIDSLNPKQISLCEGEAYTLPDNNVVRDEGSYYITGHTTKGCDSIYYYNIKVIKSPAHLKGSPDTCLNDASTIRLNATPGYDTYWWDNVESDFPYYDVHSVGTYLVRVDNYCGSKTDTIQVFDQCNFPIYFPSGFTPNGDALNDVLKVPSMNRNNFRRLMIFNRWGQLVFQTTRQDKGWDGTLGGLPQPAGVYVYFLQMRGLSGEPIEQKGTVALIR